MFDEDTLQYFIDRVEFQPDGCWYWTGSIGDGGYGNFGGGGFRLLAHRASYLHFVGAIPRGAVLDHLCHTWDLACPGGDDDLHRRCVNWTHLDPVTQQVNVDRSRNAAKDRCGKGHLYTPENTYIDPRGRRFCRICQAARGKEWLRVHHPGVRHGTETHCPQGHPYAGDNLIITKSGGRACRQCKRDWSREDMRRRRARAKADRTAELAAMEREAVLLSEAGTELVLF